jgi:hypothetical protein
MDKWDALVQFDDEIREAAEKLRPFGEYWVDRLADAYFALHENRKYLPSIVARLTTEAEQEAARRAERHKVEIEDNKRRVEQEKAIRFATRFAHTADGSVCTERSLNLLRAAEAQGYNLGVQADGTFTATRSGTSYLRSNEDIERFAKFGQFGVGQVTTRSTDPDNNASKDEDDNAPRPGSRTPSLAEQFRLENPLWTGPRFASVPVKTADRGWIWLRQYWVRHTGLYFAEKFKFPHDED